MPARRHHLIPKFYQRLFANQHGRVQAVNRDTGKSFVADPIKLAVEKDFYTVELDEGGPDEAEKAFSQLESFAAQSIEAILGGEFPPTRDNRDKLAAFMALQFLRGESVREGLSATIDHLGKLILSLSTESQVREHLVEAGSTPPTDTEVREILSAAKDTGSYRIAPHQNDAVLFILQNIIPVAELLLGRTWQLLRFKEDALLTSDNPLVGFTSDFGGSGLALCDELRFPLGSKHALVMAHHASLGEVIRDVGERHAMALNCSTATNARRWIIHNPDHDPLKGLVLPKREPMFKVGGAGISKDEHD